MALYEGTKEHAYQMSLCALTGIYSDYIKLVHFDGELLHIFLKSEFKGNHITQIRRIFEARMWLPDAVLNDILTTQAAMFSTRERVGNDVVETTFKGLKTYEGEVNHAEIKVDLMLAGITDRSSVALVYTVEELQETVYHDLVVCADIQTRFIGGSEKLIDPWVIAQELRTDPIKLKAAISAAERFFATSGTKTVPKLRDNMNKKQKQAVSGHQFQSIVPRTNK